MVLYCYYTVLCSERGMPACDRLSKVSKPKYELALNERTMSDCRCLIEMPGLLILISF